MTYYKYVKRDATSQVNWADVSKKFSDEISRIGTERDKKRAEIDKATDELVTKINEAPMGQHKNANLFTSQLVDQATQDTLRMNKLLKSGDIKPSEYMNYIENQKSSVTGIYDMVKGYQDVYTDKMERLQNGESLSMEADGMAVVEGFGNFANITPVMDMYGNVTMYNNSTGDTMSSAQMNAITKQYFNAYDLDGDLTGKAGQLGDYVKVIMADNVLTRADVTASPEYEKVKTDLIDATLEGNLSVSTVLDKKLVGYGTSYSAKTAGERDILMIDDPRQPGSGAQIPLVEVVEQVSNMTEDQKREIFPEGVDVNRLIGIAKAQRKEARKWVETDLTSRFDMIETPQREFAPTPPTPPTRLSATERKGISETRAGLEALAKVYYGDEDTRKEGLNEMFGQDTRITSYGVRETPDGGQEIYVQQYDPDTKRVVERTPISLGENFRGFAEAAGTQFFEPTYIRDVLPGIEAMYKGQERGEGESATTRQPIITDLGSVEITFENEKRTVGDLIDKNLNPEYQFQGFSERGTEAAETANVLRSVLNSTEVGMNATVAPVDERDIQAANPDAYTPYSGVQIFVQNRMDKPIVVPNSSSSHRALAAILQKLSSTRYVTADELLALLPEEAKAYNDPRVIASIFTEEVTQETPVNSDPLDLFE
jgi:hypothetical protein